MKVLLQNAKLVASSHSLNHQIVDILITDGIIREIGKNLVAPEDATVIDQQNKCISSGWTDCFAHFSDPGEEYNEDIISGAKAAAAGGYTDVITVPNTDPAITNKGQIDYLIEKAKSTAVTLLPTGAVTQSIEGKSLAEMYDMADAGAVAFTDGYKPIQSSGVMLKALEYVLAIDSTIIQVPDDKSIGTFGQMNEGIMSTRLGMPGKPGIGEEIILSRDIELLRYTQSRLHVTGVSSRKSLELIRQAKNDGLKITCSVTPYHLIFTDEDLTNYDTHLKVNPPLRTDEDRIALINAVKDGTIDFIASHHHPLDYDHKICEFQKASFGMETLESVFGAALTAGISTDRFVEMQTKGIRKTFNLAEHEIKEGNPACLTLFSGDASQVFTKEAIRSKSQNNAFIGRELKGNIIGVINKGQVILNRK